MREERQNTPAEGTVCLPCEAGKLVAVRGSDPCGSCSRSLLVGFWRQHLKINRRMSSKVYVLNLRVVNSMVKSYTTKWTCRGCASRLSGPLETASCARTAFFQYVSKRLKTFEGEAGMKHTQKCLPCLLRQRNVVLDAPFNIC